MTVPKADGPRGPRRPQRPGPTGGDRRGPPRERPEAGRAGPRKASNTEGKPERAKAEGRPSARPERGADRAPERAPKAGAGERRDRAGGRGGQHASSRDTQIQRPFRKPRGGPAQPSVRQAADDGSAREGDRIAKLMARAGVASRRDIERMIGEGRIALNGEAVTTPATLLKSLHGVTVDGKPVSEPEAARLFLFHKPAGFLTAARDPRGRPTIYDRLPADMPRVMPVGRLDMTTEGLLLLTTDGGLKRQLELPSTGIERTYRARAFGTVTQAQLEALIDGIEIDGMRYGRIDANLERRTGHNQWIEMTITEGKNREVRRVLEYLGLTVNRLIRTRYGPFTLDESEPGALMEVRQSDLNAFRKTLKK
ncbi:MAG: pseudouridine synthase [Sphingobium sp.]|nr:pseudouridine synthase [Sphingobium sp.]